MTHILFICGSLRKASTSAATVRALIAALPEGMTGSMADIAPLPHYNADLEEPEAVRRFKDDVAAADAVVFVTPEYNYSVPGVLKNAIDWASRPAYASVFRDRRCLVITTSGGALGGVRAQAHLKYILQGMLAQVFAWQEIVIPAAASKVENGLLAHQPTIDFALEAIRTMTGRNDAPGS